MLTTAGLRAARLTAIDLDAEAFIGRDLEGLSHLMADYDYVLVLSSFEIEDIATVFGDYVWHEELKTKCGEVAEPLVGEVNGVEVHVWREITRVFVQLSKDDVWTRFVDRDGFIYDGLQGSLEDIRALVELVVEGCDELEMSSGEAIRR